MTNWGIPLDSIDKAIVAAGNTAISRKTGSAPIKWLYRSDTLDNLIEPNDRCLDYGCGKGADVVYLKQRSFNASGYDPNHASTLPEGEYDFVTCTYVLNTIPLEIRRQVYRRLAAFRCPVFVTVRRDIKTEGLTSKGTYQENVACEAECRMLGIECTPIYSKSNSFEIYRLEGKAL